MIHRLALCALLSAFPAAPLIAQEGTTDVASTEPDDLAVPEVSVLDRWRAAPETIFDAAEIDIDAFLYVAHVLIVISNTPNDPMVADQLDLLRERMNQLVARDVIIVLDTDPEARTSIRAQFRPRGFSMILVGKDGRVALRKPVPWAVREIVHTIDRITQRD